MQSHKNKFVLFQCVCSVELVYGGSWGNIVPTVAHAMENGVVVNHCFTCGKMKFLMKDRDR